MSASNIVAGKQNSIEASGGGAQTEPPQYLGSAPVFARSRNEPEPNCVVGERLQPPQARPHREASRTLAEAREIGLSMPEALDLTPDEVQAFGEPPESAPDQRRRTKRGSRE